ncbi:MAG: hypothetical protein ACI865_002748 [Flavobacteriaceae bacterium]|jgi:hypothetical protein
MNRAFYIVGIVFSVVFMTLTSYYAEEVQSARYDYLWDDYSYSSYDSYDSYDSYGDYTPYSSYSSNNSDDLTMEAGLWSLFFFLCFLVIDILGMIKVKTKTMKVMGILGVCFTGILFLWNLLVIFDPGAISFDEVAPAWVFYCLIMLAFTIVGLVQSVRYHKIQRYGVTPVSNVASTPSAGGKDLLDD